MNGTYYSISKEFYDRHEDNGKTIICARDICRDSKRRLTKYTEEDFKKDPKFFIKTLYTCKCVINMKRVYDIMLYSLKYSVVLSLYFDEKSFNQDLGSDFFTSQPKAIIDGKNNILEFAEKLEPYNPGLSAQIKLMLEVES